MSFNPLPYTPDDGSGPEASDAEVTASVAAAVAALVSGAPGALDTLNELAAALGDDANFAATITTALAGKSATGHDHSGTYVAQSLFDAAGDLLTATANDTPSRLAMGSALQVLRVNAGATALEYATPASGGGGNAIFGDGSDGAVTIASGTTTLTRDMYYDTLVVQSGGILKTDGYKIFCKTSCTVDNGGTIDRTGAPAITNTGGASLTPGSLSSGSAGSSGTTGVGVRTGVWSSSLGGGNGAGGAGSAGAGGAFRAASVPIAGSGGYRGILQATSGQLFPAGAQPIAITGGVGGSSGAGDGTNPGGGGGGGGGILILVAKTITNSGTISAHGGPGAGSGSGNTGGGGGGGGGAIFAVYNTFTGTAPSVTGGAGGAGSGTGVAGSAGLPGLVVSLSNA